MNIQQQNDKIRTAKNNQKNFLKGKYEVEDLQTDKELSVYEYDDGQEEIKANSSMRFDNISISSKSTIKSMQQRMMIFSDDLVQNSYNNSHKISHGQNQSVQQIIQSQTQENNNLENESDEEQQDDQTLSPDQKLLKEKWIQISNKLLKNKIKQDEAFDYPFDEELQLSNLQWRDSGCILECITKLYSLKVEKLQKEAYQVLAQIVRGEIGVKKNDMINENEMIDQNQQENQIQQENQNDNNKRVKLFKNTITYRNLRIFYLITQIFQRFYQTYIKQFNMLYKLNQNFISFWQLGEQLILCIEIILEKKIFHFEEKGIEYGTFQEFNSLSAGQQSIEKPEKLIVDKYDLEFDLDPLFRRTSKYFDEASTSGLLINSLSIDKNLSIRLSEIYEEQKQDNKIDINNQNMTQNKNMSESKSLSQSKNKSENKGINNNQMEILHNQKQDYIKVFQTKDFLIKNQKLLDGLEIDLFPELVDFKETMLDEIRAQTLDLNDYLDQQQINKDIRILNHKRMEVMNDNTSNYVNKAVNSIAESDNDKSLFNEINQSFQISQYNSQNITQRNMQDDSLFYNLSFQNKDFGSSFSSQNYIPDNSILSKANKKLRFNMIDENSEFSQDVFSHDDSSQTLDTRQIDNSLLSNSILKIGGGDKEILSQSVLNTTWGDPKQWELQKLNPAQRKKLKQKRIDDLLLGEIKEDMEAESQNENYELNGQYNILTQTSKYIDFSIGDENKEDYYKVIGKRFKRNKENLDEQEVKIKQKYCEQIDYKFVDEKIFQIGLKDMRNNGRQNNNRFNEYQSQFSSQFDIFQKNQHKDSNDQYKFEDIYMNNKYLEIGFDDLYDNEPNDRYYNPEKYNKRDNSIFNKFLDNFNNYDHNYSMDITYQSQPFLQALQNNSQNYYTQHSKTQNFYQVTENKKNIKMGDLKRDVWTTMTQQKDKSMNSQLNPLSNLTNQRKIRKRAKKYDQKQDKQDIQDAQIDEAIKESDQKDLSLKFSDLVYQLPDNKGESINLKEVSLVSNCFLSLLHLANEKQLRLIDLSQTEQEFFIFLDQNENENNSHNKNILSEQMEVIAQ